LARRIERTGKTVEIISNHIIDLLIKNRTTAINGNLNYAYEYFYFLLLRFLLIHSNF